jgi:hypothetical protein
VRHNATRTPVPPARDRSDRVSPQGRGERRGRAGEALRHWPHAPHDTYAALGHGGKRALVVIPSLDLVASWNDSKIQGRDAEDQVLGLLAEAAR